jgi:predicted DNA-binding protein
MARKPYKPSHLVRTRLFPVRVSQEEFEWLTNTSQRLGVTVADLMRNGARAYAAMLEQKGGPRKEKLQNGSQKVISKRHRHRNQSQKRDRLQVAVSKEKT